MPRQHAEHRQRATPQVFVAPGLTYPGSHELVMNSLTPLAAYGNAQLEVAAEIRSLL